MNYVPVPVAVKPHVRAYLIKTYGSDRIKVNNLERDPIFQYITSKISRPYQGWKPAKEKAPCSVTFLVSEDIFNRIGNVVTSGQAEQFCCFVDGLLRQEFYTFMYIQIANNVERKQAILAFIDWYDLETAGLNFDALKKAFYRYEKKNSKKLFGNFVPPVTQLSQESKSRGRAQASRIGRPYSQTPDAIRQRKSRAKRQRLAHRFAQLSATLAA